MDLLYDLLYIKEEFTDYSNWLIRTCKQKKVFN